MKLNSIIPALAVAFGLAFTGCKEGHDHDHDHDHDHHDHDHAHEHGDKDADKTQAKAAAPADTQVATKPADGAKPYPLDVCLVADKKLGSMGAPYVFTHEGQEIKFCCEGCMPSFEKDPKKYLAKLTPDEKPVAAEKN